MFYVYALKSKKNNDIYVGCTANLKQRLEVHNKGKVRSTKALKPWVLVYYEAYLNKFDVTRREKQLKNHKPKEDLKEQLKFSLSAW